MSIEAWVIRMQLMSSKMTFFYKRIFPIIWFGFLAVFFLFALFKGLAADPISALLFLIVPAVMAVIGYQFMKRMAFNLVDEVFDVGDALLVRSGDQEERVVLADIKNVNFFPYMSPPQVTLSLRRKSVVRRRDCVLCANPITASVAKPNDRKADRPHRCGAAERVRAAVPLTPQPALCPRGRADLSDRRRGADAPKIRRLRPRSTPASADVRSHLIHLSCEGARKLLTIPGKVSYQSAD